MNRLKYILAIVLTGLILCSSTPVKRKFRGELYFKLISLGNFYKADSLRVKKFKESLDSLTKIDQKMLSEDNLELISIYGGLIKNGLIDKPFFNLRVDSATTYIVYTSPAEFKKVSDYHRNDLLNENKKVQIELTGEILNLGTLNVINCSRIDKVEKVDGKTYWTK